MATRTFVADGTSRNWSATSSWVEGAVPTAADDVVFSTNVASSILVINGNAASPSKCRSFNTTGYTRTIQTASDCVFEIGDGTAGDFTLTAGLTFTIQTAAIFKFVSTTTGNNITWAGYLYKNITFDGVGGAWTFQDNLTASTDISNLLTLTNGSVDVNGKNVATGTGVMKFSSNNSNTRSLTLGACTWRLADTGGTVWDITNPTGMTLDAGSSTITMLNTNNGGSFAGGGLTYGTLSCTTLTTGNPTISGANTFATLTLSCGATAKTAVMGYMLADNQTVTGTFTANGNTDILRNFIRSNTVGTARTITAAVSTVTRTDFRDITGAGAATWNLATVVGGSGDCGGNSGITFSTPRTCYMKTAVSVNWSASNWYTTSGGSTSITTLYSNAPAYPLPQDTAILDANSVTAGSRVITFDIPRYAGFNWTGVANSPTMTANSIVNQEFYGSMILSASMTVTLTTFQFTGRGLYTIDTAGQTPAANFVMNAPGGIYSLAADYAQSGTRTLAMTNGTLRLSPYSLTVTNIQGTNGYLNGYNATAQWTGGALTFIPIGAVKLAGVGGGVAG